ncbi:MAG: sulfite exporter TauE/SafE family protein [Pyrinomonadaceae bacterium]
MSEILFAFSATSTFAILGFGFLLGLKHATEADHLAAVSTIVTERKSLFSSALIGGVWGLGHTISLFIAGIFVLLLNFQISEQTERTLEFCVGIMLFLLGVNVIRKLAQGGHLHFHAHEHGGHKHVHPHIHEKAGEEAHTHHGFSFSPRALVIGMVHGLAGSAALMLLVIPTIESRAVSLLYIIIFGIGSIGGMMLMSFLVGLPFQLTAKKFNRLNHLLQGVAGLVSIALGLFIIYEKGVTEGLFG